MEEADRIGLGESEELATGDGFVEEDCDGETALQAGMALASSTPPITPQHCFNLIKEKFVTLIKPAQDAELISMEPGIQRLSLALWRPSGTFRRRGLLLSSLKLLRPGFGLMS